MDMKHEFLITTTACRKMHIEDEAVPAMTDFLCFSLRTFQR
jgi:hypothetical protein